MQSRSDSGHSGTRRRLVYAGVAAGLAAAAAWRWWPEQGWTNPCLGPLPPHLANHELVQAAWTGIDPEQVWDCHAHLAGIGDANSGIWFNPRMESWLHPVQYARRLFYLDAACTGNAAGQIDPGYVLRMRNLLDDMRPGVKAMLLAFDYNYREDGTLSRELSSFHTPNEYALRIARAFPRHFEWIASIHPYRRDAVAALENAAGNGARAVKWLPAAMGIDPASPFCDPFYAALARLDVPLLSHAGIERAVESAAEGFNNPLRLRRALERGVRVVVAHCASTGEDRDIDRGDNGPVVGSFTLFTRLMDEPRYAGRLFGDLSAMPQTNRSSAALASVIERTEWHPRLLNGSDYPLPGIMPLYSVVEMEERKLIAPAIAPVLTALRRHNPLLFDFVLKRHLQSGGKRFAAGVFETRRFFTRRDARGGAA